MNEIGPVSSDTVFGFLSELMPGLPPRVKALTLRLVTNEAAEVTVTYIPDVKTVTPVRKTFYLVETPYEEEVAHREQ